MTRQLQPGDVVRLLSGGPKMTVYRDTRDEALSYATTPVAWWCAHDHTIKFGLPPTHALEMVVGIAQEDDEMLRHYREEEED